MATDSINNNYTIQKGQTLWQLGKSLGIKDSELNVWCQQQAAKNHITDPTKIKTGQTITLEGLTVEKNTEVQQNESTNNETVPQNNNKQTTQNDQSNKQTVQQTDYIVQNGETPEAIVKKMYIASGNAVDVNSAEFKEAVADFIEVNKDQVKNVGGHKGLLVGSTVKLPGEYDTIKMGMKSREEAISSYTSIIKAKEAKAKELENARKTAADLEAKAKAAKAASDKTNAELAKLRKGDGNISAGEKLSNAAQGAWDFIKKPFCDEKGKFNIKKTLKTVAKAAAAAVVVTAAVAVVVASGGTAAAVIVPLIALGVAAGGTKVVKGAIKASKATTNDEARQAWREIGAGVTEVTISVAGARTGLKSGGISTSTTVVGKNGMLAVKEMNAFRATAKCIVETPNSIKTTLVAFKNAPKNMPAIKTNLASTAKTVISAPKTVFTRKPKSAPIAQETVNTQTATSAEASSAVKEKFTLKSLVPKFLKKKPEVKATTTEATSAEAMKTKLQSEHNSLKTELETTKSSADKQQIQQDMNKIEGELFNRSRGSKLIKRVTATKEKLQSQLDALKKELETTKSPADKQKIEQEIAQIEADLQKQPNVQVTIKAKETAEKGKFKIKMPKVKLPKIFRIKAQPISNKEALTGRYNKLKEDLVMVPVTNTRKRIKIQSEMAKIQIELLKI